jgi:hypothetical protein
MALKIIKSTEPITIKNVVFTIYGTPGSGKTSFAYTAEDVLLLDFNNGAYRAHNRSGDTVQVAKWLDVLNITADDLKPYKTLVIDTIGDMVQVILAHIELTNPKFAKNSMLLYGELIKIFRSFVAKIKSCEIDLVFIAHFTEEKKGDQIVSKLDAGGKSKNDVYSTSDQLGYLECADGVRILNFDSVDGRIGKNTGKFAPINLTKTSKSLAEILEMLKVKINTMSEEQLNKIQAFNEVLELIKDANTLEDCNSLLANEILLADPILKQQLHSKANKELGFIYDANQKLYVIKEETTEE